MKVAVNKVDWLAIIVILLLLTASKKELVDILTLLLQNK